MRNIWTTLYYLVWWHLVPSTCYNGNFEICNFPPSWAWAIISNLLNATRYPTISLAWLDRWHQVGLQRYDQLFCAHNELWRPFLDYLFRNWREKFGCMAWSWSVGIVLLLHDDGIQDKVISRARAPFTTSNWRQKQLDFSWMYYVMHESAWPDENWRKIPK